MKSKNSNEITLFGFLKPYLTTSAFWIFVFTLTCLLAALEPSLKAYLLKCVIDIISKTDSSQAYQAVLIPAVLYVSMDLYHNLNMRAYAYACIKYYPELKRRVMNYLFEYTSKHSVSFFQANLSGDIADKIQDITNTVEPFLRKIFIARIFTPIIITIFLFQISWKFAVIFMVWTLVFIFFTIRLSKPIGMASEQYAKCKNRLSGRLIDVLGNIVTAKIFGRTSFEKEKLNESMLEVKQSEQNMFSAKLKLDFFLGLMTLLLLSTYMALLIKGRMDGEISVGDFVFVLTLLLISLEHVYILGQAIGDTIRTMGEFKQAINIILLPIDVIDLPNAKALEVTQGEIAFRNVDFFYVPANPIFTKLNVVIRGNEKVGIVGTSGAGKSTFVNLLLRLFELQQGSITIDGQEINEVTMKSLRDQITLVPQQTELFHRSILDNIRYGYLEATEDQIFEAAKLAECDEFIEKLPEKYNTLVGERGIKLSGGQKQRIAIARAYLKPSKILILDEPTAALDSITESYIQRSLCKVMQNKTTLIIAHRLSTLKQMDRILVFSNGTIVQEGTLSALIEAPGPFAELWKEQLGIHDYK